MFIQGCKLNDVPYHNAGSMGEAGQDVAAAFMSDRVQRTVSEIPAQPVRVVGFDVRSTSGHSLPNERTLEFNVESPPNVFSGSSATGSQQNPGSLCSSEPDDKRLSVDGVMP